MAQRLNISISESLFERLQAVKESIKVSKVCQQALEEAIFIEELKNMPDLEKMIQRLKFEKEKLLKPYKAEGLKDGMEDALKMDLQDLIMTEKYISNIDPDAPFQYFASDMTNEKYDKFQSGQLLIKEIKDQDGNENWELVEGDEDPIPGAKDAYWDGWNEGVIKVWTEVKSKI